MNHYNQEMTVGFKEHSLTKDFILNCSSESVWDSLIRKDTFTLHQIWPYRVEFMNDGTCEMSSGEENIHHGPFMSFVGVMGTVERGCYRDLKYYYGSYFLSFRLIRPYRLQIWVKELEDRRTAVTVRIDSYVKPYLYNAWTFMQNIFWSGFGKWIDRLTKKRIRNQEITYTN
ncbi:hypothetical protein OO013_09175 [Mangrovivirga sp. M17]|uniref:SRPBCC family protein n=1 Tax=Mangrovivirga halotolerans TaxID=2993936 RepID=A0ABT3RQG7_9BACT|nr:hypothetical protein [Mangrovivirga halotolerans]MCX2744035.1 hypothetical protein [Mangrovivirga halotolerans]